MRCPRSFNVRTAACRGGWDREHQRTGTFELTQGEKVHLTLRHGNYGGPGYLSVAMVQASPEQPSWASLRGEAQRAFVSQQWRGEVHTLELGDVDSGSVALEFAYYDRDGMRQVQLAPLVDVSNDVWNLEYSASYAVPGMRVGVTRDGISSRCLRTLCSLLCSLCLACMVFSEAARCASTPRVWLLLKLCLVSAVTDSGVTSWSFEFQRPSPYMLDGPGYSVTIRSFNASCFSQCTAGAGTVATVVSQADPFDWGANVTLAWNGAPPTCTACAAQGRKSCSALVVVLWCFSYAPSYALVFFTQ